MKVYVLLIDSANDGPSVETYATRDLARKGLRDYLSSHYTQEDIDDAIENELLEDDYACISYEEDVFQIQEHTVITGGDNEAEAPTSEAGTNDRIGLEEASNQAVLADEGSR